MFSWVLLHLFAAGVTNFCPTRTRLLIMALLLFITFLLINGSVGLHRAEGKSFCSMQSSTHFRIDGLINRPVAAARCDHSRSNYWPFQIRVRWKLKHSRGVVVLLDQVLLRQHGVSGLLLSWSKKCRK